jgi:hypothetical protein
MIQKAVVDGFVEIGAIISTKILLVKRGTVSVQS